MKTHLLLATAVAILPTSALAGAGQQACIDQFHLDRDACLADFKGTERAQCMKEAVARKQACFTQQLTLSVTVDAASVSVFSLGEIGLSGDAVILETPPGDLDTGYPEAAIFDGRLVVAAPGDVGTTQTYEFRLQDASGTALLRVAVTSNLSLEVQAYEEGDGEGTAAQTPPPLTVSGLGEGNALGGADLVLSVEGAPTLSLDYSKFVVSDERGVTYDVSGLFAYDEAANAFVAEAGPLADFAATLPLGQLSFATSLVSTDYAFAQNYDFTVLRPSVTVTGQLVDAVGQPITGEAVDDLNVTVTGFKSGISKVVPVGPDGTFTAEGLIVETYNFVVTDLGQPNVYSGVLGVFRGTTEAALDIFYAPPAQAQTNGFAAGAPADGAENAAPTVQDGAAPSARQTNAPTAAASFAGGCRTDTADGAVYEITSAARGVNRRCGIDFAADAEAGAVLVTIEVTSAEYPTYTQQQSEFNDSWSWAINSTGAQGPTTSLSDNGLVNATHVNQGTISREICFNALKNGQGEIDPGIGFNGSITAQNVGDGAFPTTVRVTIGEGCDSLTIEKAEIDDRNSAGRPIIRPIRRAANQNVDGRYVSIPTTGPDGAEYGIPLEIEFSPPTAEITEVKLAVVRTGTVLGETGNVLGEASVSSGKVEFTNLKLPPFSGISPISGNIGLSVQLKGTIDGTQDVTKRGDVNVEFGGNNTFTPLFLAENSITGQRYGQVGNETGDDNWALTSTVNWLRNRSWAFNDVSAQHVVQTAAGRSILDHATHSDGRSIDIRYQTPENDFGNGGVTSVVEGIVSAALTEKNAGSGTAAQARLAAFIRNNRTQITAEAAAASKIYVARGTWGRALREGEYSDGTDILDLPAPAGQAPTAIGDWTNEPNVVAPAGGHVNHWHISLR